MRHEFFGQYYKAVRALARLRAIYTDNGPHIETERARDMASEFFILCYHLKDFVKADETLPFAIRNVVERYVSNNKSLRIAADLCNTAKHKSLTKPRHEEEIGTINEHIKIDLEGSRFRTRAAVSIRVGDRDIDALTLADECMAAWQSFFGGNMIDVPQP